MIHSVQFGQIQQSIKQSVENMTHFKVSEVDVHVLDVVFCDAHAVETEKEHEEESADEQNKDENN